MASPHTRSQVAKVFWFFFFKKEQACFPGVRIKGGWHDMTRIGAWLDGLVAADDPRSRSANVIALVLAWNTPFYPLYVLAVAGTGGFPWVLLNLAVLPAFAAVPAVSRIHPLAGRALLVIAGTLNTMLCIWLYGEAAGEQLFLLPCVTLAITLFPGRRALMASMLALPVLAYFLLGHYGTPPFVYSAAQYRRLIGLNGVSVGTLTAFLAWRLMD